MHRRAGAAGSAGASEPGAIDAAETPGRAPDERWVGPSRRARAIAVVLALVLAALTLVVVNGVWRRAAPARPAPAAVRAVEVRVVPSPPPTASVPAR